MKRWTNSVEVSHRFSWICIMQYNFGKYVLFLILFLQWFSIELTQWKSRKVSVKFRILADRFLCSKQKGKNEVFW